MPTYDYKCDECGNEFESVRRIVDREYSECSLCHTMARQVITACHFDPRMGADPDFPTAAARWDKSQKLRSEGRMKDSNQTRYGTNIDVEKEAFDTRKRNAQ